MKIGKFWKEDAAFDTGTLVTPCFGSTPIYSTLGNACDEMSAVYDEILETKNHYFVSQTCGIVIKESPGRFVKIVDSNGISGWCHRASLRKIEE